MKPDSTSHAAELGALLASSTPEETAQAWKLLESVVAASDVGRLSRLRQWTTLGNAAREIGSEPGRSRALELYQRAAQEIPDAPTSDPDDLNDLADLWTNVGICLLQQNERESLEKSIACFDRAIVLRGKIPLENVPLLRWGIAAGWMNRGDALTRLGSAEQLKQALVAYDYALADLALLAESPSVRNRTGIAWLNRAVTAEKMTDLSEALACLAHAEALLKEPVDEAQRQTLAAVYLNQSRLLLDVGRPLPALDSARWALVLARGEEKDDVVSAEISLKARHRACLALAVLIDTSGPRGSEDWIADTTDAVEEALALSRYWERCGNRDFRPLAHDLFAFGARIYRVCQPHFFAEYLLDALDPLRSPGAPVDDRQMHAIAVENLRETMGLVARSGYEAALDPERLEKHTRILEGLREADRRLADLQKEAGI